MSKTSLKERNKAIRLAWEREQELVSEGKGTRDWSQEQQKAILDPEKGKAYDKNGRAFEGQHMKSAAEYPEYQGDPNNIQFLTREEHLEAHKGSWQNSTNWYYNPETKEFVDFGENAPTPCEAISLSEPVRNPVIDKQEGSDGIKEPSKTEEASSERKQSPRQESASHHAENTSQKKKAAVPLPPEVHESFGDKILHVVDAVREFGEKHPVLTGVLKVVGIAAAAVGTEAIANAARGSVGRSGSSSSDDYFNSSSDDDYSGSSSSEKMDISSSSRAYPDERSSPEEHTVPAHGQHYHTKDGVIWKEKEPYQRGGKHDDED
jgi:hypothetical protein